MSGASSVSDTKSVSSRTSIPLRRKSESGTSNKLPLNLENVSLVGRDEEIKTLVQAYERIRRKDAVAEVIQIRGESGSGKSVLVENLRRIEKKGREFFVMGKYNQYDQPRPYDGFVDATADLSVAVSEIGESLDDIRVAIQDSMTCEEIQLLLSIMPAISFFLPHWVSAEAIEINEQSFNRFKEVYRKFLRCICSEEHPLVLFLDDLQWVDDESRQLIDSIVKDSKMRNLLLIGAVREDPSVSGVYDLTSEAVLCSSEIVVGALSKKDVNLIISRATLRSPSETEDLSAVVYHKTGGNAYFATQYLDMLHREDFLTFSFESNRWEWDVAKINSLTNVSDNVVQILVRKIESLNMDVQIALIVAAYLGFSFSIDVVECILESTDFLKSMPSFLKDKFWALPMSKRDTHRAMAEAARSGLVDGLSDKKFKFSHDRVQQSVISTLHEGEERQCVQTALGTILLEMSQREDSEDWMLFAAVDLLLDSNKALPVDIEFSKTCLQAANMASNKAAFRSAAKYADAGISYLHSGDMEEERYDLWLELSNLSAEMHFSRGDFEGSRRQVESILKSSQAIEDCFRANRVSMNIYTSLEDWEGAVECGTRILNDFGVPTPRNPRMVNVVAALIKCKWLLKGRRPHDLEDLPPMDNPRMAEALSFLGSTAFCSWMKADKNRCTFLCLKMFILTIEYGICTDSPYAFAAYGMCMSHIGEYTLAYEYGRLAVKTLERPGTEKAIAKTMVVVHSFLNYLQRPIQESLEPLLHGYTSGMRHGDVVQGAYALRVRACLGVFAGMHLAEHERYAVYERSE
jgi:predicted ATPase